MVHYELTLMSTNKERFKSAVKAKLQEKHMTLVSLAELINRPLSTVYNFMYNKKKPNRFVAAEIANALGIEYADYGNHT